MRGAPSGLADRTDIDTFVAVENRDGLFPIHRGLKFLLIAATRGGRTGSVPCRFGIRTPDALDSMPDSGGDAAIEVSRELIDTFSGAQCAVPDVRTPIDVAILARCAFSIPALSASDGWGVRFGRELNATDDRRHFTDVRSPRHLPIVEGKQIQPFVVDTAASRWHIASRTAAQLLGAAGPQLRRRLAYRDVAAATNRLTLIAAIVPAGAVTTHTLFCLKDRVPDAVQLFLCGVFNSYVANYLVRTRVGTHVTVAIVERLPVPRPSADSDAFRDIAALAGQLSVDPSDGDAAAHLQARVAALYGLSSLEFQRVLDTFPLVPASDRAAAMNRFIRGVSSSVTP